VQYVLLGTGAKFELNPYAPNPMASAADLPILSFDCAADLRRWLELHHATSRGMWLRIYKAGAKIPSVTFLEVLDEGLCFGWSESTRRRGDEHSYLQRFTPRRAAGTASQRNRGRVDRLIREGRMTPAGVAALGAKAKATH
jgi:uncharacterized protein YdeI (YjbR/CyaY-like superfamily)